MEPAKRTVRRQSAGLLLFRRSKSGLEVLLAHPGGPFWRGKDEGAWTIPKGEIEKDESLLDAALREFAEETGYRPKGKGISLGSVQQSSSKIVHVWAIEDDWDTRALASNAFQTEWPPRSGRMQEFPEVDRAAWMKLGEARTRILKGQAEILDRLEDALSDSKSR